MELVIDITEEDYKKIIEYGECDYLRIINAIENGIPLPEGAEILSKEAYSDLCMRAAEGSDKE